jgi:hypothetical protein
MHNAPPVVYPVGRFALGRILLVLISGLSALGIFSWQSLTLAAGPHLWGAWLLWGGCGLCAALWLPKQYLSDGHLFWSGEAWFWQHDTTSAEAWPAVRISVGLDFGQGLLLWVQPLDDLGIVRGRMVSAWLEAGSMPSKWHGFRCAVYSRPKTAEVSGSVVRETL